MCTVHMCVSIYVYAVYVYICMYISLYIYIYIYIHNTQPHARAAGWGSPGVPGRHPSDARVALAIV